MLGMLLDFKVKVYLQKIPGSKLRYIGTSNNINATEIICAVG